MKNIFSAMKYALQAVYEVSTDLGIKLTEKALVNIEVKTTKLNNETKINVPLSSIVYFQDQVGVYRLREGWFKLIAIKVIKKDGGTASIKVSGFNSGDELVISGADLLRVSEMDALGGGE